MGSHLQENLAHCKPGPVYSENQCILKIFYMFQLYYKKVPFHLQTFAFDHCFWSMEENNPKFAGK